MLERKARRMMNERMTMSRGLLFFAPHVAVVLVVANADAIGWEAMIRLVVAICAAMPWWWSSESRRCVSRHESPRISRRWQC